MSPATTSITRMTTRATITNTSSSVAPWQLAAVGRLVPGACLQRIYATDN